MKERPMLFSGPMVRAIQLGTKTQTRRMVKPMPGSQARWLSADMLGKSPRAKIVGIEGEVFAQFAHPMAGTVHMGVAVDDWSPFACVRCPYGAPGDWIWVRETFYAWGRWETRYSAKKGRDEWHFIDMTIEAGNRYRYAASMGDNGPRQRGSITPQWWKRPAIYMPRVASRITLEIVSVRVERLNDISEADAIAEGISVWNGTSYNPAERDGRNAHSNTRGAFGALWESINGPDSWAANSWVWVPEFRSLA